MPPLSGEKETLGQALKSARDKMNLTLRQVEELGIVSNAYLSQLENDKIKKPSAQVLYKLSNLYNVHLEEFLYAAGYIDKRDGLLRMGEKGIQLTPNEEQELLRYLQFLRTKR